MTFDDEDYSTPPNHHKTDQAHNGVAYVEAAASMVVPESEARVVLIDSALTPMDPFGSGGLISSCCRAATLAHGKYQFAERVLSGDG